MLSVKNPLFEVEPKIENKILRSQLSLEEYLILFFESLYQDSTFQKLKQLEHKKIQGAPFSSLSSCLYLCLQRSIINDSCLLIMPSERECKQVYEEFQYFYSSLKDSEVNKKFEIFFFPNWGILPYSYGKPDPEKEGLRSRLLSSLSLDNSKKVFIFSTVDALLIKTPFPESYRNSRFHIWSSQRLPISEIHEYLNQYDYKRSEIVEKPGEYSVKGGLIDIYCPGYFNPIRIDFFEDTVESIRFFDPLSQDSLGDVREVYISPLHDLIFEADLKQKIHQSKEYKKFSSNTDTEDLPCSEDNDRFEGIWDIYPLFMKTTSIFEYFKNKLQVIFWDKKGAIHRSYSFMEEQRIFYDRAIKKFKAKPESLFLAPEQFERIVSVSTEFLPIGEEQDGILLKFGETPSFKGRISEWIAYLRDVSAGDRVFISITNQPQKDRIERLMASYQFDLEKVTFLEVPFKSGFLWQKGILFTDKEIFGKHIRLKNIPKSSIKFIDSFTDLNEGDHIVHINYGIGKFISLKRMTIRGHQRDFLELVYADQDKLFLPLEQLGMIHRYIGPNENPALDHLGKRSSWEKRKAKANESIQRLAEELLELYAKREQSKGVAFPSDSIFQEEFEASFEYEETEDQIKVMNEIKKDMESIRPMDRLICGDVGYGKTEMAVRASFKTTMAGKQVAILCPTTILTLQHFHTFQKRFQDYPINIDFISRFRSNQEIRRIKASLREGGVDIIIGTHSLLGKDIHYKNLGLLVIDEEQKFGVTHKESIRKIKANIDTLTMTASPIPRTLQISLVGIRDLSLIEIPPRNRKKIETHILTEDEEILKQAILKELDRHGQVYVLHNRVKTISVQAHRLRKLFPEKKIAVMHGQMPEEMIENIMLEFYDRLHEILICTTIIESGIDIPNVNTLIALDAHRFGLSQLYQLRGRIGRSERQAYAYFFYPRGINLTETALKRLHSLQDYDQLGAGFKIAMKDLEIRGAGNILGREQSGNIMDVGFEIYVRLLNEKFHRMEPHETMYETNIIIPQDFFIPDDYIKDTRQKIEFYKKMTSALNLEDLNEVQKQLLDRFGKIPEQIKCMLRREEIRILAGDLKLEKVTWDGTLFSLEATPLTSINMDSFTYLAQNDSRIELDPRNPKVIFFTPKEGNICSSMEEMIEFLSYL